MNNTDALVEYRRWLWDQTTAQPIQSFTEITTPFLDRRNDHIQVYACETREGWFVTDDGSTVSDFFAADVDPILDVPWFREQFSVILKAHGAFMADNEMQVRATDADLGLRIDALVQAMLAVDTLYAAYCAQCGSQGTSPDSGDRTT